MCGYVLLLYWTEYHTWNCLLCKCVYFAHKTRQRIFTSIEARNQAKSVVNDLHPLDAQLTAQTFRDPKHGSRPDSGRRELEAETSRDGGDNLENRTSRAVTLHRYTA